MFASQENFKPDRERVRSVLIKNDTIIKTSIFAGNYEQVIKGDTVTHFTHIYGGEGLCAINVLQEYPGLKKSLPKMYYVHPDHLGSLTIITNAAGNIKQKSTFDAWGKRTLDVTVVGVADNVFIPIVLAATLVSAGVVWIAQEIYEFAKIRSSESDYGKLPPPHTKNQTKANENKHQRGDKRR